jgi:hypothetical protein
MKAFPHDSRSFRTKWSLIVGAAEIVDGLTMMLTLGNKPTGLSFDAAMRAALISSRRRKNDNTVG